MTKAEEMIRDYNLKYNYKKNDYELSRVNIIGPEIRIRDYLFPVFAIVLGVLYGRKHKARRK